MQMSKRYEFPKMQSKKKYSNDIGTNVHARHFYEVSLCHICIKESMLTSLNSNLIDKYRYF